MKERTSRTFHSRAHIVSFTSRNMNFDFICSSMLFSYPTLTPARVFSFLLSTDWPIFSHWGTPEIQISWHLFGRTRQAAYVSQVMCTQTCNLQIINMVLIRRINLCHFVGIVSPHWSTGFLPAATLSKTVRVFFFFFSTQIQSGASKDRRVVACMIR